MKVKILTQIAEENKLLYQLNREVKKAKKAIIAVSFIQRAGLNLFFDYIREILNRNKKVEIFTSGYMGITDPKALKSLLRLNKIYGDLLKVYFKPTHKFHAKYFFFERSDKSYCVFLGSSNISETGLSEIGELNVKIIGKHNDSIHKDLKIVIDNLKKDREFKLLNQEQIEIYQRNYKKGIRIKNKLSQKNKSPKIKEGQHIQRMVKVPILTFDYFYSRSDHRKIQEVQPKWNYFVGMFSSDIKKLKRNDYFLSIDCVKKKNKSFDLSKFIEYDRISGFGNVAHVKRGKKKKLRWLAQRLETSEKAIIKKKYLGSIELNIIEHYYKSSIAK